jgi:hypothetical protein
MSFAILGTWVVVLAFLAMWSLAAWSVHAVVGWIVGQAGAATGAVAADGPGLSERLSGQFAPWLPPEVGQAAGAISSAMEPAIDGAVRLAPALASGLEIATIVIWAIGSVVIVAAGVVAHRFAARARHRGVRIGGRPLPLRHLA